MDYQVDHSSFSTKPNYAHMVSFSADNRPWVDQFYFSSTSIEAVRTLSKWANTASVSTVIEGAKNFGRIAKGLATVRVKKSISPSTLDETKTQLVSDRLEFIYCNDAAAVIEQSQSRIALRGVVEAIEDLIDAGDYLTLDSLIAGVDPQRLRPITNVAFLRASFQAKNKLQHWKTLYQVVYAHLASAGQDPTRALRGLSASRVSNFA